ncbi:MAG: hypothetical protein HYS23_01575 [Geobacter sp.]|nr:hypothetical protein [Geobacter sp.]
MAAPPRKASAAPKSSSSEKSSAKKTDWLTSPGRKPEGFKNENACRFGMQVIVTLIILGLGSFLLIKGSDDSSKLGAGLIGSIVGFWIK